MTQPIPALILPGQSFDLIEHPPAPGDADPAAVPVVTLAIMNPVGRAQIAITAQGLDELIDRLTALRDKRARGALAVVADIPDALRDARG